MTEHRFLAAMMWVVFAISSALALSFGDRIYTFIAGMAFGSALLASLICWKWGI